MHGLSTAPTVLAHERAFDNLRIGYLGRPISTARGTTEVALSA